LAKSLSLFSLVVFVGVSEVHGQAPDQELPPGAILRLGTSRWHSSAPIRCGVFSPDGKTLALGGVDGVVRLWDTATGKERLLPSRDDTFGLLKGGCLAFSPDSKLLAVPSSEAVVLFDVGGGKVAGLFKANPGSILGAQKIEPNLPIPPPVPVPIVLPATSLAFSPDGKSLATGTQGRHAMDWRGKVSPAIPSRVVVWEVRTGKELWAALEDQYPIWHIGFSPDGNRLAAEGQVNLAIYDAAAGKLHHRLKTYAAPFAFGPGTKTVCYRTDDQHGIIFACVDVLSGKRLRSFHAPKGDAIRAPGERLVVLSDKFDFVWDVLAERKLCVLDLATGAVPPSTSLPIVPLAVTPDGKTLALAFGERTVRFFNLKSGKEVRPEPGHREGIRSLAVSRDGKRVLTAGLDGTVCLWDRAGARLVRCFAHPYRPVSASLSPDGKLLAASAGGLLVLWDAATGKELSRQKVPTWANQSGPVQFTPDGKALLTMENAGDGSVRAPDSGMRLRSFAASVGGHPNDGSLSPDGKVWAIGTSHGIRLWDTVTTKLRSELNPFNGSIQAVAFAPDGVHLATAYGGGVALLDTQSGHAVRTWYAGDGTAESLAWSPEERMLAVAVQPGVNLLDKDARLAFNPIRLVETATGKERRRLGAYELSVTRVAFEPDGRTLASAGLDNVLVFWSVRQPRGKVPARPAPAELDRAWADLASGDARIAYDALCFLAACPEAAPAYMASRMPPPGPVDAKRLARLLADLDSSSFKERAKATTELQRLGWLAEPALKNVLANNPTEEVRRRVQGLLDLLAPSARPSMDTTRLRHLRAIEVLEYIASPAAVAVLESWTRGSLDVELTNAARASLKRLKRR
jgi:WD40 repeat protein